jgi:hypothetical protein
MVGNFSKKAYSELSALVIIISMIYILFNIGSKFIPIYFIVEGIM